MEMKKFNGVKGDLTVRILSKLASKIAKNKLGSDCDVCIQELILTTDEEKSIVRLGVSATATMHADDIEKLIFQGGKRND